MSRSPRTWFITGADKGLGLETAKAALSVGDRVVVTVLDRDGFHPLADSFPDRFRAFALDARDLAALPDVVAAAHAAFGRIDILVNNAGFGLVSLAETTKPEAYRPLFEVNFFALVEMTRAVLPILRKQRSGHIINLSSYAGFMATPGFGLYAASKFAVEGFSEAVAKEVRDLGIRVTIVEPGGFRSDFAGPSLVQGHDVPADYAALAEIVTGYAARRHGKQPNNPALFGTALLRLVDLPEPPVRLPLGRDAHDAITAEVQAVQKELALWRDLSVSTTDL